MMKHTIIRSFHSKLAQEPIKSSDLCGHIFLGCLNKNTILCFSSSFQHTPLVVRSLIQNDSRWQWIPKLLLQAVARYWRRLPLSPHAHDRPLRLSDLSAAARGPCTGKWKLLRKVHTVIWICATLRPYSTRFLALNNGIGMCSLSIVTMSTHDQLIIV